MPHNKLNISGAQADVLSWVSHGLTLEEENMLRNVSRLPCLFKHVALMPDAHLGKGSMVGSVIASKDAVIPAIPTGFSEYKESLDDSSYWDGWNDFKELHEGVHDRKAKAMKQLGTLGGGNHFIEVCL